VKVGGVEERGGGRGGDDPVETKGGDSEGGVDSGEGRSLEFGKAGECELGVTRWGEGKEIGREREVGFTGVI